MLRRIALKVEPVLTGFYRKFMEPPPPNLRGDRHIEYSWIVANMPEGPGTAMDFGTGPGWSWMGLLAARKGFDVVGVDLQASIWPYVHPRFRFVQGDILELGFPAGHFDLIINCSTIEHVGLAGHYAGTRKQADGDLEAMRRLLTLLKPGGVMLLTIPVGLDRVFAPLHRVYGGRRLPLLLDGWEITQDEYWVKDELNRWLCVDKDRALNQEPIERCYSLGLFAMRKGLPS